MRLLFLLLCLFSFSTHAFDPKDKPVIVIIPFAPGGGADEVFRHIQKYAETKNVSMVAMYKPGADGMLGTMAVHSAAKDGFTLGIVPASTLALHEIKNPNDTLSVITGIKGGIGAFVSRSDSGIKTIIDLERALQRGDDIKFGYGAQGQLIVIEQFFEFVKPKTKPLMVPFKGGNPTVLALLSGYIDVTWVPYVVVHPHVEAGKVQLLAFTGAPNTPSMVSRYPGWKDFDGQGIVAPAGFSATASRYWASFFRDYLNDSKTKEDFISAQTPILAFGPAAFEAIVKRSKDRIQKAQ